jgi:hypothetical protein
VSRHDEPFEIKERIRIVAYILKLSERLKLHLTLHMSYFKLFHDDQEDLKKSKSKKAPHMIYK